MMVLVRLLSLLDTKSIRTCTLRRKAYPPPSMKTAANRYHWISNRLLEPIEKALRTMALPALMSTAARTSQRMDLPMASLKRSICRDAANSGAMDGP